MASQTRRKRSSPAQKPAVADPSVHSIRQWWMALSPEHRKGYSAIAVGFLAGIMVMGMTPFARHSWIYALSIPLNALFGWAAIVALTGTLITCGLLVAEVIMRKRLLSVRWLACLAVALWLVMTESDILFGPPIGGILGEMGAVIFSPIPPAAAQILIIGAYGLDGIVAFQLSWSTLKKMAEYINDHLLKDSTPSAQAAQLPVPSDIGAIAFTGSLTGEKVLPLLKKNNSIPIDLISTQPVRPLSADVSPDSHALSSNESTDIPAYLRQTSKVGSIQPAPIASVQESAQEFVLPPLPPKIETVSGDTILHTDAVQAGNARSGSSSRPIREITGNRTANIQSAHPAPLASHSIVWGLPPLTLLTKPSMIAANSMSEHVERLAILLDRTLRSFGVDVEVRRSDISIGPTVIRFGIRPTERMKLDEQGRVILDQRGEPMISRTRVSRIMNLKNDLALVLEAKSLRMEAPVPERPFVGLEIPNVFGRTVLLREILESREYQEGVRSMRLPIALGRDVAGRIRVGDLTKFPHTLIAGATGSGKSVCLNTIICSLVTHFTPNEVKFLMIDPKMVELTFYQGIPHLLSPVITDPKQVVWVLDRVLTEMERRYHLFAQIGVRNLDGYQEMRARSRPDMEQLPFIIVIIDELADLMMLAADEVERQICRLAQLARATGIHLVVATQRPSVDVVTGLIKANIPTRIAFMVSSSVDSRTIIDGNGAEQLLGKGDSLFLAGDAAKAERIQSAFISDEEVEHIATFWRKECAALGVQLKQWSIPAVDHN